MQYGLFEMAHIWMLSAAYYVAVLLSLLCSRSFPRKGACWRLVAGASSRTLCVHHVLSRAIDRNAVRILAECLSGEKASICSLYHVTGTVCFAEPLRRPQRSRQRRFPGCRRRGRFRGPLPNLVFAHNCQLFTWTAQRSCCCQRTYCTID